MHFSVYGSGVEYLDETAALIGYTIDTFLDVASGMNRVAKWRSTSKCEGCTTHSEVNDFAVCVVRRIAFATRERSTCESWSGTWRTQCRA